MSQDILHFNPRRRVGARLSRPLLIDKLLSETHGEPRFEFGRFLQGTGAIEDDSGTDNEIRRRISMSVPRLLRSPFAWCVTYRCPAAICRLFLSSNRVFL